MRCRFCDTDIADKALICYRCGRATSDPKIAPPPSLESRPWTAVLGVLSAGIAAAAALPAVADGMALWGGWTATAVAAGAGVVGIWRYAGRRR